MAYTPIEYIQSNGNQYIDTGYHANDKTKIEILLSNSSSSACYPFGSRDDTWLGKEYSVTIDTAYVFQYKGAAVYTQVRPKQVDLIITDIPNITVNNVQFSETIPDSYNCEKSMYIFALNKYGSAYKFSEMKIYYMKIWDDGTLIFDLIPVLDENNVACLYNKVTGTYLYNAGTGDFVAGNPIAKHIITIGTPSTTKISSVVGHDQATVTFQSDMALQSWEARATLPGITPAHGVGLLVESGGSLAANTDATVYVDDEELTNGDNEYTITVNGIDVYNYWSDGIYDKQNLLDLNDIFNVELEYVSHQNGIITFDTSELNVSTTPYLKIQTWLNYSYVAQPFEKYSVGDASYTLTKTSDFNRIRIALHGDNQDASIYSFMPDMVDGVTYSIKFKVDVLRLNYCVIQCLVIKAVV